MRKYTTIDEVIESIETDMGADGSRENAKFISEIMEEEGTLYYDSELQAYIRKDTEDQFSNYWERLDRRCANCYHILSESIEESAERCEKCNWINSLGDIIIENPLIKKHRKYYTLTQIAFPNISESEINLLPEKQREAVIKYFKNPQQLTAKDQGNLNKIKGKTRLSLKTKVKKSELLLRLQDYF